MSRATLPRARTSSKKSDSERSVKSFRSAVNYLDSLINYERLVRAPYNNSTFGLQRTTKLLHALENPHKKYKTTHIAGTKGKGSTATMLAEMVRACGLKVGLYTSPHVLDIRERIVVDGEMISEADFARAIAKVAAAAKTKGVSPTYFEVLTVAAFHHFSEVGVELAVIETGLGGRLDSTNVIQPEVCGITSISLDHLAQLGDNLVSIATEKAGIFKKGVPVISSPQRPNVKDVLERMATESNSPIRFSDEQVDFSYRFEFSRSLGRHARICLTTPTSKFEHLHVPLQGEHQAVNCALALGMLDVLKSRGLPIDDQKATAGLANVKMSGRMQLINEKPRILVDGAHNAASVDALVRAIGQNITYDSMVVIFGCSRDKDISGMVRRIQLGADKIIFTKSNSPRAADPAELAADYSEHCGKMAQVAEDLDEAMQIAVNAISREDLICITGSFYLVAEAIRKYSKKA